MTHRSFEGCSDVSVATDAQLGRPPVDLFKQVRREVDGCRHTDRIGVYSPLGQGRLSRQQLISIADGYFTGLQKNDGKGIQGKRPHVAARIRRFAAQLLGP
jgi:hypothetical protein